MATDDQLHGHGTGVVLMAPRTFPAMEISEESKKMIRTKRRAGKGWGVLLLAPALLLTSACSLDEILEVELPGRVRDSSLDDPALAQTLVNSVIGDTECAWNQYTAGASIHSDEWMPSSGNLNMREWGQRKIFANHANHQAGCGAWAFPNYTPLHTARFQADDIFRRLGEFDASVVTDKTDLQATVRAWGAFAALALSEGYCTMVLSRDGEPGSELSRSEANALTEGLFAEAIQLAQQSGNDEVLNMALVGRARARLNQGNYSGAISDAQQVPDGFLKVATRDGSQATRWNYHFERMNATSNFREHGSITPGYRDQTINASGEHTQADGVADSRVNVQSTGALAADFATIHYFHDKANSREAPVPMASFKEAQLIIAEASVELGDLQTAIDIINDRHARAGVPAWGGSSDQAEVLRHVLAERKAELFAEGGHRLNDMIRYRGTAYEIPFLGEPGSDHPSGVDQTGAEYGDVTCFELPLVESLNNPNTAGG
jgi:hypothetical protein